MATAPLHPVSPPASPARTPLALVPAAAPTAASRGARRILSLRWIATLLAAVLSASAALSVGFISERSARQVLVDEIQNRLLLQGRNLAAGSAGALLTNFPELTVQPLVKAILARQPEIELAVVLDKNARTVGHPMARFIGQPFEAPAGLVRMPTTFPLAPNEALSQNDRLLVATAPVLTPDHRVLGSALVAIDRSYVEKRLDQARRQQFLVILLGLSVSVLLSFLLMSRLLRPVTELRRGLQRIGRGDLETPIRLRDRTELGALAHTVNDMARDLKHAQAVMLEQGRLEHEVDIARQIQRSLLPAEARRFGNLVVCGDQRSATEVGGDYYDVLALPDGRIAIAIADVSGKGLPGCLVMAMLSASLHALRGAQDSPSQILVRLDAQFAESLQPGMFVTMFYAIIDPVTNRMVWASAGHNPMLIYRAASGNVVCSDSRGIPLGALRNGLIKKTLADQTLQLEPGDVMVQCTDGYTEAMHADTRELFGLDRLAEVVRQHGAAGVQRVIEASLEAVHRWTRGGAATDDETLLVLALDPHAGATAAAPGAGSAKLDPRAVLSEARARGARLELSAAHKTGPPIMKWLRSLPGFEALPEDDAQMLGTALLEVCDNIAEHGYAHDAGKSFDLWWIPPRDFRAAATEPAAETARRWTRAGWFVVRDDAASFSPDNWKPTDFNDRQARTRGRGYGLDIIHRVMKRFEYLADTSEGNLSVLAFGPKHEDDSERNGR